MPFGCDMCYIRTEHYFFYHPVELVFMGVEGGVGAVVAQWIKSQTLNREVPGSNLLAATVVLLSKALYPHCLVPQKGHKAIGPLVACLKAACFLSGQVKYIRPCNL